MELTPPCDKPSNAFLLSRCRAVAGDGISQPCLAPNERMLDRSIGVSATKAGARYIVIDGMAIIQHGFVRATEDIDLLVDGGSIVPPRTSEEPRRLIAQLLRL